MKVHITAVMTKASSFRKVFEARGSVSPKGPDFTYTIFAD